jgi:LDH2 family malate/lactate/ureidoglycolate dehydrogenase
MLQQGQMANQRAANVGGGALSGNTLQGLQKFTQDYAGNAYQNAFQNYQTQRNNIYNTLAGIAGIGQTGQTAANTAATNATNAATQLGVGSAAAQAAGTLGQTGAYTGAINNALNNYTLASLLSQGGRVA